LGFHRYAVNTHPDEFIPEPPPSKKILDPPAGHRHSLQSSRSFVSACSPFYVKSTFFIELYLTLQTNFAARWCFSFSANDSSIEQVRPPLL